MFMRSSPNEGTQLEGGRVFLGRAGASLIIRDALPRDQAEYRCVVHYRRSPSETHRLQLLVTRKYISEF